MNNLEKTKKEISFTENEIDIKEFFHVIWTNRIQIIIITIAFAFLSLFYSLSLTNMFRSESLSQIAGSSGQDFSNSISTLADMAGISAPKSDQETKAYVVMEVVSSRAFLKHLMTFDDVLPSLMAAKEFDWTNQKLIFDKTKYDPTKKKWIRKVNPMVSQIPSVQETYVKYKQAVGFSVVERTGFIRISIKHQSPIFAKDFLDLIIGEVNTLLRKNDLQESTDALTFLKNEMSKTSLLEIRSSINDVIESQLKTQMMAKVREDYVLKLIEPPFYPEVKFSPNRPLISILGTLLGLMVGTIFVVVRFYVFYQERKDN